MQILYIVTSGDNGGAQKYVSLLASHFHGSVASGTENTFLAKTCEKEQVPYYPLPSLVRKIHIVKDIRAIYEMFSLIKKLRPDIVHVNSTKAGILGSIAGALAGTKIVYTIHGFILQEKHVPAKKALYWFLEWIGSLFRDYTICVSESDERLALKTHCGDAATTSVVHNSLPTISFMEKSIAREKLSVETTVPVFGTIANLYKTKGIDILIDACKLLDIEYECLIIGDGPEKEYLINKVHALGLSGKIKFFGAVPSAATLLKAFDLFVLPSRKEGLPFAYLEAQAAGIPIVATDTGGIGEMKDTETILVPIEDPIALARAIKVSLTGEKSYTVEHIITASKNMFTETEVIYKKILS